MTKLVTGVKKIAKGLKKVFKKVVKSPLFKIALLAGAIYLGGAAMGAWGNAGAGAGAGAGTVAGTAAAGETATAAALEGAATGAAAGATGTAAGSSAAAGLETASLAGSQVAGVGGGAAGNIALPEIAATAPAKKGIISSALKNVGGFVKEHPMASAMMFNAASSALSPDEIDMLKEEERIRRSRFQNMQVPGSVNMEATGRPLYYVDGRPVFNPQGIINRGMKA